MVLLTAAWFIQRRFIQIGRRRPPPAHRAEMGRLD
jgi:hypothetical protein